MYYLLIKNFFRSRAAIVALALTICAGFISILIGKQFLTTQQKNITATGEAQRAHLLRNAVYVSDEMGLYLYYAKFALVNAPDPLAGIAIGQKDINPSIQSVTIRGLEAQKYDTDLNNPFNLLSGNFDLGFVVIYLFPLLIISLTYNLLSEEKEWGTWTLVAAQAQSIKRLLLRKILVRMITVFAALAILIACAVWLLSAPPGNTLVALIIASFLYCTCWFAISLMVVSLKKPSGVSAMLLLSVWLVLAILLPAGVNSIVSAKYPVPEAFHTLIKQRDRYHEKFDMDKKETVEKFYAHYPQFRKYPLPDRPFSWLWYYAMQQMGDDESANESKAFREKLLQRDSLSHAISAFVPTMQMQLLFTDLARSGLRDHLGFLDATTRFHEKMRVYFYPKIFAEAAVASEDWVSFTPQHYKAETKVNWVGILLPQLLIIIILVGAAMKRLQKQAI